jgi:glutaredoxin/glutathione-dependent peroxiredoxin
MTIQIGEPLPKASFTVMGPDGPAVRSTEQIFKGKKIVLFGVAAHSHQFASAFARSAMR